MQHSRLQRIENLHISQYVQAAKEYIIAIVTDEFEKANFPPSEPSAAAPHPSSSSSASTIKAKERALRSALNSTELEAVKTKAIEIAQASIKTSLEPSWNWPCTGQSFRHS